MNFYSVVIPNATPIRIVTGRASYGIGFFTIVVGLFCNLFGIQHSWFSKKLLKAEWCAMRALECEAEKIGADGVMDIHCEISGLSILVYGTAYKL